MTVVKNRQEDFNYIPILKMVLETIAGTPGTRKLARIFYNSSSGFVEFDPGSGATHRMSFANDPFARANHTGTQASSTISDLAAVVKAYRLDEFAVPTAAVSFNSQRLTSVADPTTGTDGANRQWVVSYVDSQLTPNDWKNSARVVATSNITLSGTQTIDGVAVVAGDRVLATGQTTAANNGLYVVAAGAWSRAADMDATGEVTGGTYIPINEGTSNADTLWYLSTNDTITLGTTSLSFQKVPSGGSPSSGSGAIGTVGNAVSWIPKASGGLAQDGSGAYIDTADGALGSNKRVGVQYKNTFTTDGTTTSWPFTHNFGDVLRAALARCVNLTTRQEEMFLVSSDAGGNTTTIATEGLASPLTAGTVYGVLIG